MSNLTAPQPKRKPRPRPAFDPRITRGIASEYIADIRILLADSRPRIVLYCRVSNEKQERKGNLRNQVVWAVDELAKQGYREGANLFVFQTVERGSIHADRSVLDSAILEAKQRQARTTAMIDGRDRLNVRNCREKFLRNFRELTFRDGKRLL